MDLYKHSAEERGQVDSLIPTGIQVAYAANALASGERGQKGQGERRGVRATVYVERWFGARDRQETKVNGQVHALARAASA